MWRTGSRRKVISSDLRNLFLWGSVASAGEPTGSEKNNKSDTHMPVKSDSGLQVKGISKRDRRPLHTPKKRERTRWQTTRPRGYPRRRRRGRRGR